MRLTNLLFLLSGFSLVACNGDDDDDQRVDDTKAETSPDDIDADGDGFAAKSDCDDTNPLVFPGAPQLCDGLQNDCSAEGYPAAPARELDDDGDGYVECDLYLGSNPEVKGGGDCDDVVSSTYPRAVELCDGVANNCAAATYPEVPEDEVDGDGDGVVVCDGWQGTTPGVDAGGDCDDHSPIVAPGAPELCDGIANDCNAPTWPALPPDETDTDLDGYVACAWSGAQPGIVGGDDCAPQDSTTYPGAPQRCDGIANNCSATNYPDVPANETDGDGDGFVACSDWSGNDSSVVAGEDCDDDADAVYPGAAEICDGVANDCGADAWPAVPSEEQDEDGDGYVVCAWVGEDEAILGGGDCAAGDGLTYPEAEEQCDGVNNNCLDTAWPAVPVDERDGDGDGYVECADWSGDEDLLGGDCDDAAVMVHPDAPELCDGVANDCNAVDWPVVPSDEEDGDADGYVACDAWVGDDPTLQGGDCAEGDGTTYPGAEDVVCDGIENDCDDASAAEVWVPADVSTVQRAIERVASGGTVCVAPGTYYGSVSFPSKPVTVLGVDGAANTVLSGGDGSVLTFAEGSLADTVVDGFTITGGFAVTSSNDLDELLDYARDEDLPLELEGCMVTSMCDDREYPDAFAGYGEGCLPSNGDSRGGGIHVDGSSPTLRNLDVVDNIAQHGGGAYIREGAPTFEGVTFTGNRSIVNGGAMIMVSAGPAFTDVTFSANASSGTVAGIYMEYSAPEFVDTTISEHRSLYGPSGIASVGSTVRFTGGAITDNGPEEDRGWHWGSAVAAEYQSSLVLTGTEVSRNTAPADGWGAVYACYSSVTAESVTARSNRAYRGGFLAGLDASVHVADSFIEDNGVGEVLEEALEGAEGGALYVVESDLVIDDTSFTDNRSYGGGALFAVDNDRVLVTDSTFDGNGFTAGAWPVDEFGSVDFYDGGYGGAILDFFTREFVIEGSTFTNHEVCFGSAITGVATRSMSVRSSEFQNNGTTPDSDVYDELTECRGGAIAAIDAELEVSDSVFTGNRALEYGGALYSLDSAFTVSGSSFSENESGYPEIDSDGVAIGGAVAAEDSELLIEDTVFTDNISHRGYGGAVYGDGPSLTIEGATFSGNSATLATAGEGDEVVYGGLGGAVYLGSGEGRSVSSTIFSGNAADEGGAVYTEDSVDMSEVTLDNNAATFEGGGVFCGEGGLYLFDSTLTNNTAQVGGGLSCDGTLLGSTVSGNAAVDTPLREREPDGGGIYSPWAVSVLDGSVVTGNTAEGSGGGIYTENLALDDSEVSDNEAGARGGGIIALATSPEVRLVRATVVRNTAGGDGGGLVVDDGGAGAGLVDIQNSLVATNTSAGNGGGLWSDVDSVIENSALLANAAANGAGAYSVDPTLQIANAVLADNAGDGVYIETCPEIVCEAAPCPLDCSAFSLEYSVLDGNTADLAGQVADDVLSATTIEEIPGFVSYDGATDPSGWDLHATFGGNLWDAGDPVVLDPDCSTSDIGVYGGPEADFTYYEADPDTYTLGTCPD